MMKIIVVSDSHGNFDGLYEVFARNNDADLFVHLGDGEREFEDVRNVFGDKNVRYVRGNNDYSLGVESQIIQLGAYRAFCTHGSRYPRMAMNEYLISAARVNDCNVSLYGHTHVRHCSYSDGVYLFNPGSISLPRDGLPPSYGIIEINDKGQIDFRWAEL